MTQVTWRAPDALVARVKEAAEREGRSLNDYLTRLAQVATDPAYATDETERLRERLIQAGLLAAGGAPHRRPDREAVARARREAARGTSLSDLVSEDRA